MGQPSQKSEDQLLRSPHKLLRGEGELMRSTRRLLYGFVSGVDGVTARCETYVILLRAVIYMIAGKSLVPSQLRDDNVMQSKGIAARTGQLGKDTNQQILLRASQRSSEAAHNFHTTLLRDQLRPDLYEKIWCKI